MSEEIMYCDEELTQLHAEIQRGIDALARLSGDARQDRIQQLNVRMQRAKQVLHSFKVEMRDLSPQESGIYDAKCKQHLANLQQLNTDLQWAKSESDRAELLGGSAGGAGDVDAMSAQQVIAKAARVQESTLESTNRSKRMIEESKAVSSEASQKLKVQTEQMKNIDADIMRVESNLKRADLLLRAFLRRMATDKFIMIFLFLIVVGILTIVIYKAINPEGAERDGFNVPDEVTPPVNYKMR